jgi:hypothetical protein
VAEDNNNNSEIMAHTPDASAYHTGGAYGTTIPRATKEGGSMGFDPHKPGKVIVDPDMEDGNLEVDFSRLVAVPDYNQKMQKAVGVAPTAENAFSAIKAVADEVDASLAQDSNETSKEPTVKAKPKLRLPTAPADVAAPVVTPEAELDPVSSDIAQVLSEQAALIANLQAKVAESDTAAAPSPGPVAETPVREQAPEPVDISVLGMIFLGLPDAVKPKKEIYFEMPQAGTMGARYHEVIEGTSCVALVYDTRYEDGYQWIPPSLGDTKIRMTLPKEEKTFICSSLGVHFHIGVLDVVVLFKHESEDGF